MTVTLTEKAEFRLRAFLKGSATEDAKKGVRIWVKDGGCSLMISYLNKEMC
jgi:iron-sulfur cluster assembly protein